MTKHVPLPMVTPKSVNLQYTLTVLKPNRTEFDTCLLCKNLSEAKRLFTEYVKKSSTQDLITLLLTVNRVYKANTFGSDIVLCRSIGKVKA